MLQSGSRRQHRHAAEDGGKLVPYQSRRPAAAADWEHGGHSARGVFTMSRLHLFDAEALDDVAGAHVLIALEGHAAFLAGNDLAHLVLEALQRRQRTLMHDDVVADEAHPCAALHDALGDAAAGNLADLGDVEDLEDLGIAEEGLAQGRGEQAGHGLLSRRQRDRR